MWRGGLALLKNHSGEDGMTSDISVIAALGALYTNLERQGDAEGANRFRQEVVPHINWLEAFPYILCTPNKHTRGVVQPEPGREDLSAPECFANLEGGHLHLQITARCNMQCSFCYQKNWECERQSAADMPAQWIYEYFRPLYERVQEINVFGGEVTFIPEGFKVFSFLSENYPAVTLHLESNGLAFNEKWQDLAVKNLVYVSFSVNAASPGTFARAIWPRGGEKAWNKVHENIDNYVKKLRDAGLGAFAPAITMVVSPETAHEIHDFVAMGLRWGCRRIHLLMNQRFSQCEELEPVMDWALREMLKMERVLAGKVRLEVNLFLPEELAARMQKEVDALPLERLQEEYAELLQLAAGRNEEEEHRERMRIRKEHGKKSVEKNAEMQTSNGCYLTSIATTHGDRKICSPPWKSLCVSFDGMLNPCPWNYKYQTRLQDYIKNDGIDFGALLNCHEFRLMRHNILAGDYAGCMAGCPLQLHVAEALHMNS